MTISPKNVIYFDGDCLFCNRVMNFIFKHDKEHKFYYASQKSLAMQLAVGSLMESNSDSIVYIKEELVFIKSLAIIEICKDLGRGFMILYCVSHFLPIRVLDLIYDLIAGNRYLISKHTVCNIPSEAMKKQILK